MEFDLTEDATDAVIWQICQDHDILMITGNRNAEDPDCLPVLTLADPDRIQRERRYAESVVER